MRREGREERMKVQTLPSDEHNTHNPLQLGADNRVCPAAALTATARPQHEERGGPTALHLDSYTFTQKSPN